MSVEVKLINKRGYKITPEKACKILKRKMDKEGIGDRMKECRYYTPDSDKRKEAKRNRLRTIHMLQRRNNSDKG